MEDQITVTGMILKASPAGDYDRRVVLLTREKGKLTAFVRGARRPGSRFVASAAPFCFGTFGLCAGRSAYNMTEAGVSNYFEGLRENVEGACYGMYFLEIADYYGRENNEDPELLRLLYQSLRALLSERIPNRLARCVFEIRAMMTEGEFPGLPPQARYSESARYAVEYIRSSSIEKLYTFAVTEPVLEELSRIAAEAGKRTFDRNFHSLEVLQSLTGS